MKPLPFFIMLAMIVGFIAGYFCQDHKDNQKSFYDGEGNNIPAKAVDLLVKSQFVENTHEEDSIVNRYFYFNLAKHPILFHNGEILYPDYAHLDTLIVTNADMLNVIFNNESTTPASDEEIYEALHIFCESFDGSFQDQFNKLPSDDVLNILRQYGTFNRFFKCGKGWIFSKRHLNTVKAQLSL